MGQGDVRKNIGLTLEPMNLERRYKLYKLGICPDDKVLKFFEFVESRISNLQRFRILAHPEFIFYMNSDGKRVMEYDEKSNTLNVRYVGIWEDTLCGYGINGFHIQNFLVFLIGDIYKTKKIIVKLWFTKLAYERVELFYKNYKDTEQTANINL